MKKHFIIFLTLLAGLFTSCSIDNPFGDEGGPAGKTTVTFSVDFGAEYDSPETKAFAENPEVKNLHLAVFTEGGKALVEYVKAEPVLATANDTEYEYSATLKLSDKPRVIHFIANGPEELNYGSEEDAIGSLLYSFDKTEWEGEDAYWGYVELTEGICDDTNTAAFQALSEKLSEVELVRNFAKIKVSTTSPDLVIRRFWLSNFPEKSSVAPYNRDQSRFETAYAGYEYATDAMDEGYMGFSPASSAVVSISGLSPDKLDDIATDKDHYAYMFECEKPVKDPLCIIIGGYYKGSTTETYYKVEIRGADGDYLPILRNFTYELSIGKVEKAGESSVEAALESIPSGGIDTNVDLQNLLDLSNGRSRIAVNETEMVIMTDDPFQLRYMFVPDITTGDVVNTTREQLIASGSYADEAAIQADPNRPPYVTISFEAGVTGPVISSYTVADADDSEDHYRPISVTPVEIGTKQKTEVVTIMGHVWNGEKGKYETIQRTVNCQMREKLKMNLVLSPNKVRAEAVGEQVDLMIGVENNLPRSLFPLEFKIQARNMTLTPAAGDLGKDLPVSSTIGIDGKPVYIFTKAVTWELYNETVADENDKRKYFTCHFETNTDNFHPIENGRSDLGDLITVTEERFENASTELLAGNDAFYNFYDLAFDKTSLAAGRPANFSFKMTSLPDDHIVFVRMINLKPVNDDTISYEVKEGDWYVYSVPVSSLTRTMAVMPTIKEGLTYIQPYDPEFNKIAEISIKVEPLTFSGLHLGLGTNDFVVVGREAQAKFHMDYPPLDGTVTIHLKNCKPKDTTLTGTGPDADGYTAYVIPATTTDVSFPVIINTGVDKASFKLTDSEFVDSDPEYADVDKLKFTDLHLGLGTNDYVVVGREAQAKFHMSDLPLDGDVTIYLNNCAPTDKTLTGTSTGSGYTKYVIDVADYVVSGTSVDVVFPVTISTGVSTASFKLTDDEFDDSDPEEAEVKKLQFTDLSLTNTDDNSKSYLLKDGNARISFSMGDMPLDNKITLALTNLTNPVAVSGVSSISGSGPYTLTVNGTDVVLDVDVASVSGVNASYTLSDTNTDINGEFDPKSRDNVAIKTRYTIDWSKVLIQSNETGNPAQGNTAVSVYTTSDCTGTAFKSFTTTTSPAGYGPSTAGSTDVDSENGANVLYYFKFNKGGVDYISDGVSLKYLAETDPAEVICKIQKLSWTVGVKALLVKVNGAAQNKGTISYETSFGSGGPINIGNGGDKGYNLAAFTIYYKKNENISITYTKDGVDHTGSFTIDQIKSGEINILN